jgi:hypothetical protein
MAGGIIRYQPSKVSAAAWRSIMVPLAFGMELTLRDSGEQSADPVTYLHSPVPGRGSN